MTGKQLMFFSTREDLIPILSYIESIFDIKYVITGLFEYNTPVIYRSYEKIIDLGYTNTPFYGSSQNRFMVMEKSNNVIIRDIPQRKGGILYAVDPMKNPQSIELTLGGIYTKEENILVMSRTGYVNENPFSESIYKELSKKIKKSFKKYDFMEWVGPDAEQKLKGGWRLVQDAKRSEDYDLKYKG